MAELVVAIIGLGSLFIISNQEKKSNNNKNFTQIDTMKVS